MARPNQVRARLVSFRVSETEYDLITGLAQGNDLHLSDYLRRRALGGEIIQPKMTKAKMQEVIRLLAQLQAELRRQGNNIHQIARYCRLKRSLSEFVDDGGIFTLENQIQALEGEYERLRGSVGEIWRLLGK